MTGKPAFTILKQLFAVYTIAALLLIPALAPLSVYAEGDNPTPEEACVNDGGFWNGNECQPIPTCDENTTYNSTTNECDPVVPETCPEGQTGTPPDCSTPQPETCPEGQTGTPPDCVTPEPETCPEGQTGTPPNCVTPDPAPEPTDACPNVNGVQTEGPCADTQCASGTAWSIEQQQCVASASQQSDPPPPPPPSDICPNIDGDQSSLPGGYILFEGLCIPEASLNVAVDSVTAGTSTNKGGFSTDGPDGKGGTVGGTIKTSNALATTTVENWLNWNNAGLDGPGWSGSSKYLVDSYNLAELDSLAEAKAETGENAARGDSGTAKVETGNAFSSANVMNVVNTNLFNSDGLVLLYNQVKGGGIDLSNPAVTSHFLKKGQGSLPTGKDEWFWVDSQSPGQAGHGTPQSNEWQGCRIVICMNSSSLTALNINDAKVKNDVVVHAKTGKNTATSTQEGDAEVYTGDAYAAANVFNMVNTNIVNSEYLFLTYNNFGDLSQSIILPSASFFEDLLAHGGYEPTWKMNSSSFTVKTANDVNFAGTTNADADTGNNTGKSSGGEIGDDGEPNTMTQLGPVPAGNGGNGGADGAGSMIYTGNAYSSANVHTDANSTLVGGASVFLFFRVWGNWTGEVKGLPNGVSWSKTVHGTGKGMYTDIVIKSNNRCDDGASGCAPVNPQTIGIYNSSHFLASSTDKALLENNVDVKAETGENVVETEQGVGLINTGDAYAAANVTNLINTDIINRNIVYGTFNIVGNWSGDISFGIGTLEEEDACPNIPGMQTSGPCEEGGGGTVEDVCPAVPGTQTEGPCANETCNTSGGIWTDSSCYIPTPSNSGDSGGNNSNNNSNNNNNNNQSSNNSNTSAGAGAGGGGGGGGGGGPVTAAKTGTSTAPALIPLRMKSATSTPVAGANPVFDPIIVVEKSVRVATTTARSIIVDYDVTVTNQKNAQKAYNAKLHDILYGPDNVVMSSRSWDLGDMEPADQVKLTYSVEFPFATTKPGLYKNVARITGQRNNPGLSKANIIAIPVAEAWGEIEFGLARVAGASCTALITTDLKTGSRGEEVRLLQVFLNTDPATRIAASGIGSPGNESTMFGALTAQAVKRFQEKYASDILHPIGLVSGTGSVYAATRAKINELNCAQKGLAPLSSAAPIPGVSTPVAPAATTPKPAAKSAPKKEESKVLTPSPSSIGKWFKGIFGN